jgi:DNA gyrase subunit A
VVETKSVDEDDEIVVITSDGILLRTKVSFISRVGRATQGVRLIRLKDGQRVSGLAKIPKDDSPEEEESLFEEDETINEMLIKPEERVIEPEDEFPVEDDLIEEEELFDDEEPETE